MSQLVFMSDYPDIVPLGIHTGASHLGLDMLFVPFVIFFLKSAQRDD